MIKNKNPNTKNAMKTAKSMKNLPSVKGGIEVILIWEKKAKPINPYNKALNNRINIPGAAFLLWLMFQKALFGLVNNHKIVTYQRAGEVKSSSMRLKMEKFSILSILSRFPQKAHTKLSTLLSLPHLGQRGMVF